MSDDRTKLPTSRPDDEDQKGESGGGAYPNPRSGKNGDGFAGGGSDHSYYGGENENATTEED